MDIMRSGSQPSGKGPAEWFTSEVRIDPLFQPRGPARARAAPASRLSLAHGQPGTPIRSAKP